MPDEKKGKTGLELGANDLSLYWSMYGLELPKAKNKSIYNRIMFNNVYTKINVFLRH
jgi:hypothetical protein